MAHDPEARSQAEPLLPGLAWRDNPYDVANEVDVLAVITEWNVYRGLSLSEIAGRMRGRDVIDMRNIWQAARCARGRARLSGNRQAGRRLKHIEPVPGGLSMGTETMAPTRDMECLRDMCEAAGRVILELYDAGVEVERKSDESPVTEADRRPRPFLSRLWSVPFRVSPWWRRKRLLPAGFRASMKDSFWWTRWMAHVSSFRAAGSLPSMLPWWRLACRFSEPCMRL